LFCSPAIGDTIYFVDDISVTATPIPTPPAVATGGQEDPESNGFTLDTNGSPTVGGDNDGVDHWQVEAGADVRANYQAALTEEQIQSPQGWTATVEGKIVSMGDSTGDAEISVTDDRDTWALRLSAGTGSLPEAGVYLVTSEGEQRIGSELNAIVPTEYHTYQLIYNPGGNDNQGTVEVYVDGVLRTTIPVTREEVPDAGGTAPRFLFGDNDAGSGGASETRWALARFENGSHPIERESLAPGEQLFVFKETFEDGAVESPPDAPQLGSYGGGGDPALITDAADPGAQEGVQYLLINRFTDPRGDFAMPVFSVPALAEIRDRVHAEAHWLWVSGLPQFALQVEGSPRYQVTLWGSDQNHRVTVYDGSQHVETGLSHTPGNWSKYEFDYVVGSDQIALTVDGESATVTVPPLDRVDGMQFRTGGSNTEAYVDNSAAYLTSVPEAILVQTSGQSDPADSGFTLETDGAPTVSSGESSRTRAMP
jgi:hypothetical protein